MTHRKPISRRDIMGRNPRRLKRKQDKFLEMLAKVGDVSPWDASLIVGCGYEYALKKFHEIGSLIHFIRRLIIFFMSKSRDSILKS